MVVPPSPYCFQILMLLSLIFFLYIASHHQIQAAAASKVEYLPGFDGPLPFQLETGYVGLGDTNDDLQVFYYFIKSENDPVNDPLMLWLSGGPGCSSFCALAFQIATQTPSSTILSSLCSPFYDLSLPWRRPVHPQPPSSLTFNPSFFNCVTHPPLLPHTHGLTRKTAAPSTTTNITILTSSQATTTRPQSHFPLCVHESRCLLKLILRSNKLFFPCIYTLSL
ncbi:hypothetical protein PIB30_043389 [Stylosanthes scabra]|uniref:Uncharacterized protein n=1 Tax=Stylosanthes scabra TaxID=79078 RepID=A0ABU6QEY4_9FABA|nr:hypothetical protein [Stylosanthes scabra]